MQNIMPHLTLTRLNGQRWRKYLLICLPIVTMPFPLLAVDVVVVVHPGLRVSRSEVVHIYRGELSGYRVYELNDAHWQEAFCRDYLNMTASDLKYIQDQALYAGRALPPRKLDDVQDMLDAISQTPNAIGYLPSAAVTDAVQVVK